MTLESGAHEIIWLLSDVDGVLTDGLICYSTSGEELKRFHVRDGLAVELARSVGLKVGLISARASLVLTRRAEELQIDELIAGRADKEVAFSEFLARRGISSERVAYIGDDLTDLSVVTRVGLSFAPSDAALEVRQKVDRVLDCRGGQGALREAVEILLRTRGQWDDVLERYKATN